MLLLLPPIKKVLASLQASCQPELARLRRVLVHWSVVAPQLFSILARHRDIRSDFTDLAQITSKLQVAFIFATVWALPGASAGGRLALFTVGFLHCCCVGADLTKLLEDVHLGDLGVEVSVLDGVPILFEVLLYDFLHT